VIDIVPTILEATGIPAPEAVDGIKQAPIEGTSLVYTFDAKNAKEPSRHKTQYFEMMGQWALYHEGWLLSTKVNRAPWEAFGAANPDPLNNQVLELYDLTKDFSQSQNLADKFPDKVKEMKELFIEEAKKYQVFPMDASVATRLVAPRPNITAGRTEFVYTRPMVGLPQGDSPPAIRSSPAAARYSRLPWDHRTGKGGVIVSPGVSDFFVSYSLITSRPCFDSPLPAGQNQSSKTPVGSYRVATKSGIRWPRILRCVSMAKAGVLLSRDRWARQAHCMRSDAAPRNSSAASRLEMCPVGPSIRCFSQGG